MLVLLLLLLLISFILSHTHSLSLLLPTPSFSRATVYKFAFRQSRADIIKGDGDGKKVALYSIGAMAAGGLLFFGISALGVCGEIRGRRRRGDGEKERGRRRGAVGW